MDFSERIHYEKYINHNPSYIRPNAFIPCPICKDEKQFQSRTLKKHIKMKHKHFILWRAKEEGTTKDAFHTSWNFTWTDIVNPKFNKLPSLLRKFFDEKITSSSSLFVRKDDIYNDRQQFELPEGLLISMNEDDLNNEGNTKSAEKYSVNNEGNTKSAEKYSHRTLLISINEGVDVKIKEEPLEIQNVDVEVKEESEINEQPIQNENDVSRKRQLDDNDDNPSPSVLEACPKRQRNNTILEGTECILCFSHYDEREHQPRVIPCGHTMCSKCLEKDIREDTKICPTCTKLYTASNVMELPVNFSLESLVKLYTSRYKKTNKLAEYTETDKADKFTECQSSESCKIITISEKLNCKKSRLLDQLQPFLNKFEEKCKEGEYCLKQFKKLTNEYDDEIYKYGIVISRLQKEIQRKKHSREVIKKKYSIFDQKLNNLKSKRSFYIQAVSLLNSSESIKEVSKCSVKVQHEAEQLELVSKQIENELVSMWQEFNFNKKDYLNDYRKLSIRDGKAHFHGLHDNDTCQSSPNNFQDLSTMTPTTASNDSDIMAGASNTLKEAPTRQMNVRKLMTGYILFSTEVIKSIINRNPVSNFEEIACLVGIEWKRLTETERKTYKDRAHEVNLINNASTNSGNIFVEKKNKRKSQSEESETSEEDFEGFGS